jgi:surface antigen
MTVQSVVEQCTDFVAKSVPSLGKLFYNGKLGNANEWLSNAQAAGQRTGNTPTPGAVVVYNGPGYDPKFGHVAIVQQVLGNGQFTVSESNDPYGTGPHTGRISSMASVEGFIYPSGTATPQQNGAAPSQNLVGGSTGAPYKSLQQVFSDGGDGSGIPGFTSGMALWLSQSALWNRVLFVVVGGALIVFGMKLIGRDEPMRIVTAPVRAAKAAA